MRHDVHHEQCMALRARVDECGEGSRDRPPQPTGHIDRHVLGEQEFQAPFHRLPPPTELLDDAAERMGSDQGFHRAIRAHHQQQQASSQVSRQSQQQELQSSRQSSAQELQSTRSQEKTAAREDWQSYGSQQQQSRQSYAEDARRQRQDYADDYLDDYRHHSYGGHSYGSYPVGGRNVYGFLFRQVTPIPRNRS
jgi:hypothetical protein